MVRERKFDSSGSDYLQINSPNGTFSFHVTSSAGTSENFSNINTGQQISCTIKIKGRTSIAIDISSSVPNTTVNGTLTY